MAHEKMPDHRAEPLGVRRHALCRDRGDDDASVGHLARVAAVATDDAEDFRPHFAREVDRANEVYADVLFTIPAADAEDEHPVAGAQARDAEPLGEARIPTLVVHPRRELAHVVGRRVGLDAAYLAKIVHGMPGMPRAAAHTQNEEAAATRPHAGQALGDGFDACHVELAQKLDAFVDELLREWFHGAQ